MKMKCSVGLPWMTPPPSAFCRSCCLASVRKPSKRTSRTCGPGCTTADSAHESLVLPESASAQWVIPIALQTSVPNYNLEWGISIDRHTLKDTKSCRWKAGWEAECGFSAPAGQGGMRAGRWGQHWGNQFMSAVLLVQPMTIHSLLAILKLL